jgi:hypothetical protein
MTCAASPEIPLIETRMGITLPIRKILLVISYSCCARKEADRLRKVKMVRIVRE